MSWTNFETALASGNAELFINRAGQICWNNGMQGPVVPKRLLALVPADLIVDARTLAARIAEENAARAEAERTRLAAHEAGLNVRLDEPGFALIAGEHSSLLVRGTLRECRDALCSIHWAKVARDRDSGCGCWVIVGPEGGEIEAGRFTKHGVI